jgi:predicted transcriptional regulator
MLYIFFGETTMKTPCEIIVWNVVPVIKKEFAKNLVDNCNLNQRETAEKLQTTEAAISRYLSGKRGVLEIADENIKREISTSANRILHDKNSNLVNEICRICKLMRNSDIVEDLGISC